MGFTLLNIQRNVESVKTLYSLEGSEVKVEGVTVHHVSISMRV